MALNMCPHCKYPNPEKVKPLVGNCYMVACADSQANAIHIDKGAKLDLYLCHQCGIITFTCPVAD